MRLTLVALALTLALAPGSPALAQKSTTKSTTGTVTAMTPDAVTVKVGTVDMKFMVDAKTQVVAPGGGTKERAAQKAGAAGTKLADVLKVGQAVSVRYADAGGTLHASSITAVRSVGADPAAAKSSNGTVQSVSATSMTINGSSGSGAKFTQTFAIDGDTKVVGKGAGSATKGGKVAITELVGNGDHVSVAYHTMGETLHASDVRVTTKATK
jgi:Domain of unknown function (DUF5666)